MGNFKTAAWPCHPFRPPPRALAPGFKYGPPPTTLPAEIKLHEVAQFRLADVALIGWPADAAAAAAAVTAARHGAAPPAARAAIVEEAGGLSNRGPAPMWGPRKVQVQYVDLADPNLPPRPASARARPGDRPAAGDGAKDRQTDASAAYEAVYLVRYCSTETTVERSKPLWVRQDQLVPRPRGIPKCGSMAPDQWRRAWPQSKPFVTVAQLPPPPPPPATSPRASPRRPPGLSPRARARAPAPEEYILAPEERGSDCPSRPQSATSSQAPLRPRTAAERTAPQRPLSARTPSARPVTAVGGGRRPQSARPTAEPGTACFVGDIVGATVTWAK